MEKRFLLNLTKFTSRLYFYAIFHCQTYFVHKIVHIFLKQMVSLEERNQPDSYYSRIIILGNWNLMLTVNTTMFKSELFQREKPIASRYPDKNCALNVKIAVPYA